MFIIYYLCINNFNNNNMNTLTNNQTNVNSEILANNILIAKFMNDWKSKTFLPTPTKLIYHSDWNWLMSVIEKIAKENNWSIGYTLENICQAEEKENLTYIEHVYKCIVSLLKSGKIKTKQYEKIKKI